MPPKLALAPLLLALAGLSGCKNSEGSASVPPPEDYLALADGNRWYYTPLAGPHISTLEKVSDDTLPDGRPVLRREIQLLGLNVFGGGSEWLLLSPHGLANAYDSSEPEPWGSLGSRPRLRLPLRAGDQYVLAAPLTLPAYDRDGDGTGDLVTSSSRVTEIAPETVAVPVGSFQTLRVTTETLLQWTLSSDGSHPEDVFTLTEWYAPGMGIVQRTSNYGVPTLSVLAGYRIGGRSSDTTSPQLLLTGPDRDAVLTSAPLQVEAQFNEALAPSTSRLTLRDATGNEVAGHHLVQGQSLLFLPTVALASGRHTATVERAEDLMGNPAVAESWSFTLP